MAGGHSAREARRSNLLDFLRELLKVAGDSRSKEDRQRDSRGERGKAASTESFGALNGGDSDRIPSMSSTGSTSSCVVPASSAGSRLSRAISKFARRYTRRSSRR